MTELNVRRLMVFVVGMGLGFVTAFLIISVGFDLLPLFTTIQSPQGVSIAEYGIIYFLVTAIPIGIIFIIWIDKFVGTEILPK
jgi:hypothetical protein